MKISDNRGKSSGLCFNQLEEGKVYVSHKYQAYMIHFDLQNTGSYYNLNLETGDVYDVVEHDGDVFTEVNAVLQIN